MADYKTIPLYIDAATGKQINEFGVIATEKNFFRLLFDETVILCCQFYDVVKSEDGTTLAPRALNQNLTLSAFGDNDFNAETAFMFLSRQTEDTENKFNIAGDWLDGTTADPAQGQMSIRIDTNTDRFNSALQTASTYQNFYFCIIGIPAGEIAKTVLAYFRFKAENRPSSSAGAPSSSDPEYLNAEEVQALVKSAPVFEFSVDGATLWHSTQTSADRYYREQRNGGEWSTAIALVVGPQGEHGTGVAPQGTYDSGTTYVLNNGVTYNGSYYRSLANDNTGNQPDTSPIYWELVVAKGNTGDTGATGATNISITTPVIWDENFEAFAYQLSDVDSYVRFSIVKTMSALKLGVVSANPTYTGNAVIFPTTGRTALNQAGWTASTGVSGAYYRDADIAGITFVTEDDLVMEEAASVAALAPGQRAVGDEDSIGSSRLYVYPTAGNDPTADGDGFYQYDTVSSQTIAVGATPAEITITASFTGYKCLELWRDTFDSNDTLDNGGVVVGMNILDGAEYSK